MGAFKGAADLVFGFSQQAQAIRANDLAAQDAIIGMKLKNQELDFNQAVMPLKLHLMQQQVALGNLENVTKGYTLLKSIEAQNSIQQVRALVSSRVAGLAEKYKNRAAQELTGQPFQADPTPTPTEQPADPSAPAATGLGLPLPSNEPGASATATPQLLPPIDSETGDLPSSTTTAPAASQALSEFEALRKSGADYFSPNGATPDPMGPPAPSKATPAPAAAPLVTTQGPLAVAQTQPIPDAVREWKELETYQRYMELDKDAVEHYGPLLPQLMTMASSLAVHPDVVQWQRKQQLAAASQTAAYEALGKISAYGLDSGKYADVLATIQSGIPIDPKALDERLKADHATRLEQEKLLFEKKIGASNVLTALGSQNPALEPIVSIGTNLAAGLSKEKGDVIKATLSDQLARGDTRSAIDVLKQTAKEVAPPPDVKRLSDTSAMLSAIKDASAALTELYDQKGKGATGPLVGRSMSDWSSDPVLRGYKVRLDAAQQTYQQAISGASVTEQEAERLRDMFPSITKQKDLNDSQIKELEKAMTAKKAAAELDVYGPRLKQLIDSGGQTPTATRATPPPNAGALKTYMSFGEADAAKKAEIIKPGEAYRVNVNGKVVTKIAR